jgi:NAD-dependent deacetylase
VHTELARLESKGIVKAVITQNIDLLHQKAGSRRVIELHGSPTVHTCLSCAKSYGFEEICAVLREGKIPACTTCGGIVKPNITFFGEALDPGPLEDAAETASAADLMLVLGSSLVVQPAASIPRYTLGRSGRIVIVNDMPTPMDSYADMRYESLEETFTYIKTHLR